MTDRTDAPKPRRFNVWVCSACGSRILGEDLDEGVTPFMIRCLYCPRGWACSEFYRVPVPTREPDIVWRKPTPEEYEKLSDAMRDHVDRGGLIMEDRRGKTSE
jgi:hypothetical protein